MNGTSELLLAFDDGEVRKILAICRQVREYITVAGVVETLPDLVEYVKNLIPAVTTNMAKKVDNRIKDLTHATHRELLKRHLSGVKESTPLLVGAVKAYIASLNGM